MRRRVFHRLTAILLCFALLFCAMPSLSVFAEDYEAWINVNGAVLRKGPGINCDPWKLNDETDETVVLNRGDAVTVYPPDEAGQDGAVWCFVVCSYKGASMAGYIRKDMLSIGGGSQTQEQGKAELSIYGDYGENTILQGDSLSVTLTVSSATPIGTWLFDLNYDPNILQYVSGDVDSAVSGRLRFCNWSDGTTPLSKKMTFQAIGWGETTLSIVSPQIVSYADAAVMEANDVSFPVTVEFPHDHVWGAATYVWAADNSMCTASRNCVICGKPETDMSLSTRREDSASCEEPSSIIYTATFLEDVFETQTKKVVTGQALGHVWGEATFTWEEDLSVCTAKSVCTRCGADLEKTVNTLFTVTHAATETESGTLTYSAFFAAEGLETQIRTAPYSNSTMTWGDANGDGAVDNKDIVRLKNFFARYDDETGFTAVKIYPSANANGDDAIDNKDIVRLKTYLVTFDHGNGVSPVKLGPAA